MVQPMKPLVTWAAIVLSSHGASPSSNQLGLPDALDMAVQQNPSLKQASLDVVVAEAQVLAALGAGDFIVGFNGVYNERETPLVEGVLASSDSREATANLTLSQGFMTGTIVSLDLSSRFNENNFTQSGDLVSYYSGQALLRLTQPLLRGLGPLGSRGELLSARKERDAAKLRELAQASLVIRQVINSYWQLSFAVRELEIRENSLSQAEERLSLTEKKISSGLVPEAEGLAVEQVIARLRAEILAAKVRVTEATVQLGQWMGNRIEAQTPHLRPRDELRVIPKPIDIQDVLARVNEANPSLLAAQAGVDVGRVAIDVAKNRRLPQLDLEVEAGALGADREISETLQQVGEVRGYTVLARLTFQQPVQNRAGRGAYRVARAEYARATTEVQNVQVLVAADAVRAVKRAQAAAARIELEKRAVELSRKNIEAEMVRFDLGQSTNFDVLFRQDEWQSAQIRHSRAMLDYLSAVAAVGDVTGELLSSYGITFKNE